MYKIAFFVPETHKERVKEALFEAGAGKYEKYDRCSWEVEGEGQFRALAASNPYIGKAGETTRLREFRVELICEDKLVMKAVERMLEVHPYEEPAYEVWKIETLSSL